LLVNKKFFKNLLFAALCFFSYASHCFAYSQELAEKKRSAADMRVDAMKLRGQEHLLEQRAAHLEKVAPKSAGILKSQANALITAAVALEHKTKELAPLTPTQIAVALRKDAEFLAKKADELADRGKKILEEWHIHNVGTDILMKARQLKNVSETIKKEVEKIFGK